MKCIQHYKKGSVKTINLKSAGLVKIKLWQPNEDVDGVKAANGSCPNWIHSLDASAMFLTVVRASEAGATHFQMIHDSFGTHVCDVPNLSRILRESYIEILQGNPLGDLRDQLQSKLPAGVELPPIPERGTVDLNDLRKAQYFFA